MASDQPREPTADDLAWEDAKLYGLGFVMVFPDGRKERLPPEAISLDRSKLLKAREACARALRVVKERKTDAN